MDNMNKVIVGGIGVLILMAALASVAQASTPRPDYACPIDGQRFATYDELYRHFITEHPAEPIDIIWE